jgi:succinate-semialdehyde dehydrogenase/glutarate-semialdehyde dehydrogenase
MSIRNRSALDRRRRSDAEGHGVFEKRNPATDQVIAQVARGGAAEVAHALSSAAGAATMGAHAGAEARRHSRPRGAVAARARTRVRRDRPGRNRQAVEERGRRSGSSADLAIFMEGEGSRLYGKTLPSPIPNRTVQTLRSPIGSCAAIMPFNSPLCGRRLERSFPRCCAATPSSSSRTS